MENSSIEWTDHTFNPWRGCTKVSPGCANCYAEALSKRTGHGEYKRGVPRERMSEAYWRQPLKWNRKPWICDACGEAFSESDRDRGMKEGNFHTTKNERNEVVACNCQSFHRARVFCASLADWLDDEVPIEWLADLLKLIHDTPNLDWLLLTKRPVNFFDRVHDAKKHFDNSPQGLAHYEWLVSWRDGNPPPNVWIGTTVENQEYADKRIPWILKIPAKVRFLSCEPLLGKVLLDDGVQSYLTCNRKTTEADIALLSGCERENAEHCCESFAETRRHFHGIDWVIVGGESGPNARPMHPDWARSLRDQCVAANVRFFFKQHGEFISFADATPEQIEANQDVSSTFGPAFHCAPIYRVGKKAAGRLLDGREWNEFPEVHQ